MLAALWNMFYDAADLPKCNLIPYFSYIFSILEERNGSVEPKSSSVVARARFSPGKNLIQCSLLVETALSGEV